MKMVIDSIDTNCTLTVMHDSIQLIEDTSNYIIRDTSVCTTSIPYTTENSFWLNEGQPSGWTQLFIAVGVPLFVVFLEKWVAKYYAKRKEKDNREKYRKTVIDWIKLIVPIEKRLSKSLSDLSNSIAQSDDMQPERYDMPITIPDKIGNVTIEQTMDAFLTDFKGDKKKSSSHIYNIISCFEFLSKTSNEITKFYDTYNKQVISCCEQWNVEINAFKGWNMRQDDESIMRIVRLWAAGLIVNKDSIRIHEKLVNDIIQLCGEEPNIAPILIRMKTILQQRKALSSGYATIFDNMSKNIDFSLEQLSAASVFFAEKNTY
ncbi:MAG: hypothetical protein IJ622_01565 [Bacteroidales bacterium]|nr:hypothetical protein [Bacteroidales bacterium]